MLISYNTLEELIVKPKRVSPRDLAELLTMSVMEVESVKSEAEKFDKVVVGLVTEVSAHPNADKLKLAKVDIGSKKVEIVCGGVNLKEGMKVALALPGAMVRWHGEGEFAPLETATIRGAKSNGMACAAAELGLSDDNEPEHGIMDLSYLKVKPGTPLAEALGKEDLIIEIDNKSITHRPDLWGHLGVARELSALWKNEIKMPALSDMNLGKNGLKVEIKNSDLCPRYMGVVLTGIKVAPSPDWLRNKVEALGMRSINNVVDAANYVMLEIGQPLHTFDLQKLASPKIIVRQAKSGELLKTLDGQIRKLSSDMLVIADEKGAIAVAGVMGGESTEVSSSTTSLVVESATFDAISIRATATALGLRSEASARFEKALDPELAELGIKRFVAIMQQINDDVKVASDLVDEYPKKPKKVVIDVSPNWINERLGTDISSDDMQGILERLGFTFQASGDVWQVTVPTWRATRDVTIKEDLLEEVARIYGYGKIIPTLPLFPSVPPEADSEQDFRQVIKTILVADGWSETYSYSFISENAINDLPSEFSKTTSATEHLMEVLNPIDAQSPFLRPMLLPNMITQGLANTLRLPHQSVRLFEIGRVFTSLPGELSRDAVGRSKIPNQPWHLALLVREPKLSLADTFLVLKGAVEGILSHKNIRISFKKSIGSAAIIMADGKQIGVMAVTKFMKSNLKPIVATAEIDLSLVLQAELKPIHLGTLVERSDSRDLAIIVPRTVIWEDIESVIREVSPLIAAVEVFDRYEAKGSIAFHVVFRGPESEMSATALDGHVKKIKEILINKFNIEVRDH